jgi:hypothetical protein
LLLFFSLQHLKQQDNLGIEGIIIKLLLNTVTDEMYDDTKHMLNFAIRDLPAQYFYVHPWITG